MSSSTKLVCAASSVALIAVVAISIASISTPPRTAKTNGGEQVLDAYSKLPVAFMENRGQTNPRVRFYAQGQRFAFYLTPEEVVLQFVQPPQGGDTTGRARYVTAAATPTAGAGTSLGLRFLESNPQVIVNGEDRAPGDANYFKGNDPNAWQTQLARYSQVVYHELWTGIDLRLHEQTGTLKYEFRVRPGARVSDVRLAYTGADSVALDANGQLLVRTPLGTLRDAPPVVYQEIAGARVAVESRYDVSGGSYGFTVGSYDPRYELVIDPGLDYSTYLGGTSDDYGAGIAVDAAGNTYIVGVTQSPDFPTTAGAFDRTGAASNNLDVFVSKINPTGTALVYSTFIGGSNFDWGRAIAIDTAGNAYITGQTRSSSFPTTGGAFDRTFNVDNCPRCGIDTEDAFVAKLNPSGSALVYSTFLGGFDLDDGLAIAIDTSGNAYVTGETGSLNFPVTAGAFHTTKNGAFDTFVTKLNATGSALIYSTYMGGTEVDFGERIAISKDGANSAYIMGATRSPDFPTTPGAFRTTLNGMFDVFVAKLNTTGSALIYSTFLGGSDMDGGGGLALDVAGNAYVAGGTSSTDFPTTAGAFNRVLNGNDGFITKINATGTGLVYSTFLGGSGSDGVSAIVLDAANNAYLAGVTGSTDFPTTAGAYDNTFAGGTVDAFVAELNADASALIYSTFLGGSNSDGASDLARDTGGSLYVTGQTRSNDFPTTPGAPDRVFKGNLDIFWGDAFIAKITPVAGAPVPPSTAGLQSLTVSPDNVTGGATVQATLTLTGAAPAGGITVPLTTSNTTATIPASVTVPQGATSVTFAIPTTSIPITITIHIMARFAGVTLDAALTVNPSAVPPPPPPPQNATLTVTATGRSGVRVTSTPAGINVAVGSNGSATFASGTAITLSASSNRDTVWSGACSSGGKKVKSCTFTLNANASVTANVQ